MNPHGGHDKHAGHSVAMFRDKFWISFALTIPTLIWGHMLPRVLNYSARHRSGVRGGPAGQKVARSSSSSAPASGSAWWASPSEREPM
jgi:hypothetical protein